MRKRRAKYKSVQIVICPISGRRLCRDNKWREFANFGTYPECVKIFKYPKAALKAGARYRIKPAQSGDTLNQIVYLYDGDSMDASGKIYRESHKEV
jgi:hypothetical protein